MRRGLKDERGGNTGGSPLLVLREGFYAGGECAGEL